MGAEQFDRRISPEIIKWQFAHYIIVSYNHPYTNPFRPKQSNYHYTIPHDYSIYIKKKRTLYGSLGHYRNKGFPFTEMFIYFDTLVSIVEMILINGHKKHLSYPVCVEFFLCGCDSFKQSLLKDLYSFMVAIVVSYICSIFHPDLKQILV